LAEQIFKEELIQTNRCRMHLQAVSVAGIILTHAGDEVNEDA